MHSHIYCKTLPRVTKARLINSVHECLLQLKANGERVEKDGLTLDNLPAITRAKRLMKAAGHIGFTS